ncbi:energy transducer TonB [Burkholderia gladioli pv. gladioli]|uniref:Energy transducer TonB n=1 Tax=Burkholderia gladioli TaxID=28095 RepID=A0A095F1Q4_BURGA|nr:energy transducer TonB [Burkholderia gladioli]AJW97423.1 hypothetical protein BM43_4013 [Burkholderia gladioli]AWY54893.1 hypothetical protein A8H28_27875 [Burkholderia gladioli pv. gladioli]KGC11571.1 hypothetical protein DM48_7485 [Burkholderia gladioli]MDJ1164128.1 energy transducer TonB [Burkholderia gladioli pv. gladioli]PEH37903.1 energy transducer TonB [Burkholderia gladioli]
MRADPMERVSHGTALAAVVAVSIAMSLVASKIPLPERVKPKEQEFVVALQAPAEPVHAEPPKPVPPPPARTPPPPRPVPPRPTPAPLHASTAPTPVAAPKPVAVPVTPQPVTPPKAVAPDPTPAPVPTPAPPPANNVALETTFVGKLRTYIRSMTEYPTSGEARRLRPEGVVVVRFTLSRSGAVQDVDVEHSSNSPILDRQAVAIVKRGTYPAIPSDAWRGEDAHTFTVTLDFVAP